MRSETSRGVTRAIDRLGKDRVSSVVARIDESTNAPQPILRLEPLDLSMECADLDALRRGERAQQLTYQIFLYHLSGAESKKFS